MHPAVQVGEHAGQRRLVVVEHPAVGRVEQVAGRRAGAAADQVEQHLEPAGRLVSDVSSSPTATVSTSRSHSRARARSGVRASTVPRRRPAPGPRDCSALRTSCAMRMRSSSSIDAPTNSTCRVSSSECRTPARAARWSPVRRYCSRVSTTVSGWAASPCSLSSHGCPGTASWKGSTCSRAPGALGRRLEQPVVVGGHQLADRQCGEHRVGQRVRPVVEALADVGRQARLPELAGEQRRTVLRRQACEPGPQRGVEVAQLGQLVEQPGPGRQPRGGAHAGPDEDGELAGATPTSELLTELAQPRWQVPAARAGPPDLLGGGEVARVAQHRAPRRSRAPRGLAEHRQQALEQRAAAAGGDAPAGAEGGQRDQAAGPAVARLPVRLRPGDRGERLAGAVEQPVEPAALVADRVDEPGARVGAARQRTTRAPRASHAPQDGPCSSPGPRPGRRTAPAAAAASRRRRAACGRSGRARRRRPGGSGRRRRRRRARGGGSAPRRRRTSGRCGAPCPATPRASGDPRALRRRVRRESGHDQGRDLSPDRPPRRCSPCRRRPARRARAHRRPAAAARPPRAARQDVVDADPARTDADEQAPVVSRHRQVPEASRRREAAVEHAFSRVATLSLRFLLVCAALVVLWYLAGKLWVVLLPVLLGLLLATVLWPPVRFLRSRGAPPALASSVVLLLSVLLLVGVVGGLAPQVTSQAEELADQVTAGLGEVQDFIQGPPLNLGEDQVGETVDNVIGELQSNAQNIATRVLTGAAAAGSAAGHGAAGAGAVLLLPQGRTEVPAVDRRARRAPRRPARRRRVAAVVGDAVGLHQGAGRRRSRRRGLHRRRAGAAQRAARAAAGGAGLLRRVHPDHRRGRQRRARGAGRARHQRPHDARSS